MSTSPSYEQPPVTRHEHRTKPHALATRDARPPLFAISAIVILLDHLSKRFITHHILPGRAHTLIPGVLRLTHVLNTGAAFSVFADSASPETVRYALISFSILAAVVVAAMLWRSGRVLTLSGVALALILGGALGNLYDRIRFHHVIDFIEVRIVHYHWPDFNLADSCIVIGACLLILEIFRPQQELLRPQTSAHAALPPSS